MFDEMHLLLGGEAGQGLDTMAQLLSKVLIRSGWFVLTAQHVMSRVRGGHNNFRMRIAAQPVEAPADTYNILAAMTRESIDLHKDILVSDAVVLADAAWELDGPIAVPFADLAPKPVQRNVALLGVLGAMFELDVKALHGVVEENFRAKGTDVVAGNAQVLDNAIAWASVNAPKLKLPGPVSPAGRLTMDGNQAIVLGALAAGIHFCPYYPMSPATSIAEGLMHVAVDMGIVVEQAEDEIAAANMALGAAYAGARTLVPTSGGGFALMTEAVSLAGVMEMPVVFAVVQRPGPATGLPTRTEQADLDLVLYAGHGEYPRAILAPSTPKECFELAHKSFDLAETSQGPVFLLSDQFLASSFQTVEPFDVAVLPEITSPDLSDTNPEKYQRYSLAGGGISPRRLPGVGKSLVVADCHEHTEVGHITEKQHLRIAMQDKRLAKEQVLLDRIAPPVFMGDNEPDLLLVGWGSTCGALREITALLRLQGCSVGCLSFTQVWPLAPQTFLPILEAAKVAVCVEGNSTGQFAGLIRKTTGFYFENQILRYDGRAITAGYVLKYLQSLLEEI